MSEELDERAQKIKMDLAEKLMATIPKIPDDIGEYDEDKLQRLFEAIDQRAERVLALIGGTKGRGPGRRPAANGRRTERFNTPQLDTVPRRRRKPRDEDDEE